MNNILKYKNYVASVQFSEEDEAFIGRVEGIDSVVSFEGQTVYQLRQAFEEAIESYLDFCKRKGISEPQKSYTSVFNLYMHPDLHQKVAKTAKIKGISLNGFITKAVETELLEMEIH